MSATRHVTASVAPIANMSCFLWRKESSMSATRDACNYKCHPRLQLLLYNATTILWCFVRMDCCMSTTRHAILSVATDCNSVVFLLGK